MADVLGYGVDASVIVHDVRAAISQQSHSHSEPSAVATSPNDYLLEHCSRITTDVTTDISPSCRAPPNSMLNSTISFLSHFGIWPYVVATLLYFLSFFTFRYRSDSSRRRGDGDIETDIRIDFSFNARRRD